MKQYLDLLRKVLDEGQFEQDRTGTGTISCFGHQMRFNIPVDGFPLLTTKKLHFKSIVHELLWFLRGDKNTHYLTKNGVTIWKEWEDANGEVGEMYGFLMRSWPGREQWIDQIQNVIDDLRTNPSSRRHIVTQWNPDSLDKQALACCHVLQQYKSYEATFSQRLAWYNYLSDTDFKVAENDFEGVKQMEKYFEVSDIPTRTLSSQMYQRSLDTFLGEPYNIASYALLLMMIAQVTNHIPWEFIQSIGDHHIYKNHIEQCLKQLRREPCKLPKVKLNEAISEIDDFKFEDITLLNYVAHPHIKGDVSV